MCLCVSVLPFICLIVNKTALLPQQKINHKLDATRTHTDTYFFQICLLYISHFTIGGYYGSNAWHRFIHICEANSNRIQQFAENLWHEIDQNSKNWIMMFFFTRFSWTNLAPQSRSFGVWMRAAYKVMALLEFSIYFLHENIIIHYKHTWYTYIWRIYARKIDLCSDSSFRALNVTFVTNQINYTTH